MSDKTNNPNQQGGAGAVDAIRNIIFGEQEKYIQEKFTAVEKRISDLEKEYEAKILKLNEMLEKERQNSLARISELTSSLNEKDKNQQGNLDTAITELKNWMQEIENKTVRKKNLSEQLILVANQINMNE